MSDRLCLLKLRYTNYENGAAVGQPKPLPIPADLDLSPMLSKDQEHIALKAHKAKKSYFL